MLIISTSQNFNQCGTSTQIYIVNSFIPVDFLIKSSCDDEYFQSAVTTRTSIKFGMIKRKFRQNGRSTSIIFTAMSSCVDHSIFWICVPCVPSISTVRLKSFNKLQRTECGFWWRMEPKARWYVVIYLCKWVFKLGNCFRCAQWPILLHWFENQKQFITIQLHLLVRRSKAIASLL